MSFTSPVDSKSLAYLRQCVESMHTDNGSGMPMRTLVEMADRIRCEAGITIDFEATRQLGTPMVVVRVPEPATAVTNHHLLEPLSPREAEVAKLLAEGLSNQQIAKRLYISLGTAKDHVHRILTKTKHRSRAQWIASYHAEL